MNHKNPYLPHLDPEGSAGRPSSEESLSSSSNHHLLKERVSREDLRHSDPSATTEEYLSFRRRLFAHDIKTLTEVVNLVEHKTETLWSLPRDIHQDNIEALSLVMARNLLASCFSHQGIATPPLGEYRKVHDNGVIIIDQAALVFVDSLKENYDSSSVESIVHFLLSDGSLSEDLKELVHHCHISDKITALTLNETIEAFQRAIDKASAMAQALWPELLPHLQDYFDNVSFSTWGSGEWYTECEHIVIERTEKHLSSDSPNPATTIRWEEPPVKPLFAEIMGNEDLLLGRLFKKQKGRKVITVKSERAQAYINFRRDVFLHDATYIMKIFHACYEYNDPLGRHHEHFSVHDLFVFLASQRMTKEIQVYFGDYVPQIGEFARRGDSSIYILIEPRLIIISSVGWHDPQTKIRDVLAELTESSLITDAAKALIKDWMETKSCSIYILQSDEDDNIEVDIKNTHANYFNCLSWANSVRYFHQHSYDFYKVASSYSIKTFSNPDSTNDDIWRCCLNIADDVYKDANKFVRSPLCSHRSKKDEDSSIRLMNPKNLLLKVSFSRDWVETQEQSRFEEDTSTNGLEICVPIARVHEIIEHLASFNNGNTCSLENEQQFNGFKREIRAYCINILDAFFKPEKAIVKQYEKITGRSVWVSCINGIFEHVFNFYERYFSKRRHLKWPLIIADMLSQEPKKQTATDAAGEDSLKLLDQLDFESCDNIRDLLLKRSFQLYSDDVYRQADSAIRPCQYRFDALNEDDR
jgi:hypothetical protein